MHVDFLRRDSIALASMRLVQFYYAHAVFKLDTT